MAAEVAAEEPAAAGRARGYGQGREALLRAAIHVVATGGLRQLTYRAVAREAGVAHGLVAHHFGSRDALIEAALGYSLRPGVEAMGLGGAGGVEDLFAGLEELVSSAPDVQAFQYELILESRRTPELRPHVERLYRGYRDGLRAALASGGLAGDEGLVHFVYSTLEGVVFQQLTVGDREVTRNALEHLRRVLLAERDRRRAAAGAGASSAASPSGC